MGFFKDMLIMAGVVQPTFDNKIIKAKKTELEYKTELLREKNQSTELALREEKLKRGIEDKRQLAEALKTRGAIENFVYYEITIKKKERVKIKYYFSAETDRWSLLVFRLKDTLPLSPEDLLRKYERGQASLIERRTIATQLKNKISKGESDLRLNNRLFGEVQDEPILNSGKQIFYYCVMLQTESENLIYLDGKQAILEKYSRVEIERHKQRKMHAKTQTQHAKNTYDGILNQKQKGVLEEYQEMLNKIIENEVVNKKEIKAVTDLYIAKAENNSFLSEEEKEELIDVIEENEARFLAK